MVPAEIAQLARMACGLPRFLRRPMTLPLAKEAIGWRMAEREARFLSAAKRLIYDNPSSPYRRLLLWAGCDYGDLERAVFAAGLENTLAKLRGEGVYVTLAEFKSQVPICRRGLTVGVRAADFDNPLLMGKALTGATSGSYSRPSRVAYDWNLMTEHAANELVLYDIHGVSDAPIALWLPVPPSLAGIHNLLLNAKRGREPERWFSHLDPARVPLGSRNRIATEFILAGCRLLGRRVPRPRFTDLGRAEEVARWVAQKRSGGHPCVLRTYTSSAVRVARAAREGGFDLEGCVAFVGGEPLTEYRRRFIEESGARAIPRYSAAEAGLIGASCDLRDCADDMHVYLDRIAVVPMPDRKSGEASSAATLLFSSISSHTGKVLLNTDIGDSGELAARPCGCAFGGLGMTVRISHVRSRQKLTVEGVSLPSVELDEIVARLVEKAGGGPDDYQFWEAEDRSGVSKLLIAVSPRLELPDGKKFVAEILDSLSRKPPAGALTALLCEQGSTVELVRAEPRETPGHKLRPFMRLTPTE